MAHISYSLFLIFVQRGKKLIIKIRMNDIRSTISVSVPILMEYLKPSFEPYFGSQNTQIDFLGLNLMPISGQNPDNKVTLGHQTPKNLSRGLQGNGF